jgi:regulator of sigma E protease
MLLSVLAIILVFGAIVFVHELGHMLAARSVGVVVPDFSLGMGPSLFSIKWGETRYHLSAVPIGGYARIAGMEGDSADAPGSKQEEAVYPTHATWQAKNGFQKAWILAAGALANFVLALVVMVALGFIGFPQNMVMIAGVLDGSPAAEAGIQPGDLVTAIAGTPVISGSQMTALIRAQGEDEFPMEYTRGQQSYAVQVQPRELSDFNEGLPSIGISSIDQDYITTVVSLVQPKTVGHDLGIKIDDRVIAVNDKEVTTGFDIMLALPWTDGQGNPVDEHGELIPAGEGTPVALTVERSGETFELSIPGDTTVISLGVIFRPMLTKLPPGESLMRSLRDASNMMLGMYFAIRMLFTPQGAQTVAGPVGIMSIIGQSAQSGWYMFLQIVILININIGLLNLLPLPALDGGRLVFVGLHGIGIHVPEKREAMIHALGMVMLLGLIGLITFTDILAFF